MSEEKAIVVRETADLAVWGDREEVKEFAKRIQVMLPNGKEFNANEALLIAQYCLTMDLNPFRGEAYPYKDKRGKVVMVDGYKALSRWARQSAPYTDRYENIVAGDGELTHARCWILRDDRKEMIREFIGLGANFAQAYEMAATYADGVVTVQESKAKDPPAGWTWDQVARKRALKNALNLTHGAPSPSEMARLSWEVNGHATVLDDWQGTETMSPAEAEALAEMRARGREHERQWQAMTPEEQRVKVEQNSTILYGPPDFDGFDDEPPPPAPKPTNGNSKPKSPARPLDAETIRSVVRKKANWFDGPDGPNTRRNVALEPTSDKQVQSIASLFAKAMPNLDADTQDHARHDILNYLFGVTSTKSLMRAEGSALIDWLKAEEGWEVGSYAQAEVAAILTATLKDAGQLEMEMALDVEPPAQEDAPF